jgi:hypothetical protein
MVIIKDDFIQKYKINYHDIYHKLIHGSFLELNDYKFNLFKRLKFHMGQVSQKHFNVI